LIDASFGCEIEQAVRGQRVTDGAQAVAIKRRTDYPAIDEDEGGWTVPRLDLPGGVAIVRADTALGNLETLTTMTYVAPRVGPVAVSPVDAERHEARGRPSPVQPSPLGRESARVG